MRLLLLAAIVILIAACDSPTAPAEKECDFLVELDSETHYMGCPGTSPVPPADCDKVYGPEVNNGPERYWWCRP